MEDNNEELAVPGPSCSGPVISENLSESSVTANPNLPITDPTSSLDRIEELLERVDAEPDLSHTPTTQIKAEPVVENPQSQETISRIRLTVLGQDSQSIHFNVKPTTNLGKLKKTYADRVGIPVGQLRFIFDGRRIEDSETPISLHMDPGDVIDCFSEQTGG